MKILKSPIHVLEPVGVSVPEAMDKGGTYISLSWDEPEFPNGILTGYFLYQENREIYNGAERAFNVTGLQVVYKSSPLKLTRYP